MALLPIRLIPDAVLRKKTDLVTTFDATLERLVNEMRETMYAAPGIGLAAPQVGVSQRMFVMDVSESNDEFQTFINPKITKRIGKDSSEEGCLSIPGFRETIQRSKSVIVQAQDISGKWFEVDATGLAAFCMQHEIDHLDGILFTDHLSRLKKPLFNEWLLEEGISKP